MLTLSIFELERERDIVALAEVLESADNPSVRRQAAEALGDIDPPQNRSDGEYESMLSTLRTAAIEDDDEQVRTTAVTALEQHGVEQVRRLVRKLTNQPVENIDGKAYASLIKSDQPEIRMVGLAAIGLDGTPNLADVVLHAFDDPDPRVRERAIQAVSKLGLGRAESNLVGALKDDVPAVRAAAATAIGDLNLRSAADELTTATKDDNETVRLAAIDSLAGLGSPAAIEPLATALESSVPSINRLALYGLLELLTNASGGDSHQIRERVENIALDAPRTTVVETLVELLDTISGVPQQRNAVWLLGRLVGSKPTEEAITALVDHIDVEDDQTVKLATSSLVRCQGPVVERQVRQRLQSVDPDGRTAGQLAYILGRVGSQRSMDVLESTLDKTSDDRVRKRLVTSLQRIEATGRVS